MKYQWTDWIMHVPGQRLLSGMHILVEEIGYIGTSGKPRTIEGTLSAKSVKAPNWDMVDQYGTHTMITRYKLRSIADETEVVNERELDLVE